MATETKLAIIYSRVSTDEQVDKGISLDAQEKACRELAEQDGYTIYELIRDEGKSGHSLEGRKGMKRILRLAEERKFNALYMIHGDRLARNTEDHLYMMRIFEEHGVKVRFIYQPAIGRETALGYTMDAMNAVMSEHFSRVISEKTRLALAEKAKEGWYPGVAPIGYLNVTNPNFRKSELSKKVIVPDPIMAPLVTETFKLYATGNYSGHQLNEIMYEKGLRTKRGNRVHPSIFFDMLVNRIYTGELHWDNVHVAVAKHEPLVDHTTFDLVQTILKSHIHGANRRRKFTFLLRGIVKCANHKDRAYTAEWHTKKSGLRFGYYHCTRRCEGGAIKVEALEEQVEALFKGIKFRKSFVDTVIAKAQKKFNEGRDDYKREATILNSQKNKLFARRKVVEDKLFSGTISDDDFKRITDEIKKEIGDLDRGLGKLSEREEVNVDIAREILRFTKDIYRAYREADSNLQKQYLLLFFKEIFVANGKIQEITYADFFHELLHLKEISHEKPGVSEDGSIISPGMGALRESDPYCRCHRAELYH